MNKEILDKAFGLAVYKKLHREIDARFESIELPSTQPGSKGAPGDQGPQGSTGPQGPSGELGPDGPQGIAGADGINGTQGAMGAVGPQGPTGIQGAVGKNGTKGAKGAQGVKGADGVQGATGPAGAKGETGSQGPQGITGAQGATGADGKDGTQGATGAQGPQGPAAAPADIAPHVDSLRKEFTSYKQKLNAQLSTLGGGGSYKLLDNADVEQKKLSQVAENAILIFNPKKKKFVLTDIEAVIQSLGLETGEVAPKYNKLIDVEG